MDTRALEALKRTEELKVSKSDTQERTGEIRKLMGWDQMAQ